MSSLYHRIALNVLTCTDCNDSGYAVSYLSTIIVLGLAPKHLKLSFMIPTQGELRHSHPSICDPFFLLSLP